MTENEIRKVVVESAIEVHRTVGGPGLVESVFEEALASSFDPSSLSQNLPGCTLHEFLFFLATQRLGAFALNFLPQMCRTSRLPTNCCAGAGAGRWTLAFGCGPRPRWPLRGARLRIWPNRAAPDSV